jgi:hypothetical protein
MTRRTKIDNDRARSTQRKKVKRGNAPINFTIQQLYNFSQTPIFIDIIITHGWMDNIYTADHAQNERLMFIRKWWNDHIPSMKVVKEGKSVKFENQLKLFY